MFELETFRFGTQRLNPLSVAPQFPVDSMASLYYHQAHLAHRASAFVVDFQQIQLCYL